MATKATTKSNATARMAARVQAVLATRAQHHAARIAARAQQAYMAELQALASKYGQTLPSAVGRVLNGSATNIAPKHAPSAVTGACAVVRQLAVQTGFNRQQTLALAAQHGVNPATASTQYAKALQAHKAAMAAA